MSKPPFTHASTTRRISGRYAPHALAATMTLALALSGCGPKPEEPAAKPELAAAVPEATAAACKASSSWITNPSPPDEIAASETFCDFYQFSWQWFLAQVSPAPDYASNNERVFETNRLHNPAIASGQCSMPAVLGRAMASKMLAMRADKPQEFEEVQADGNALYDQNSNILYYNVWYSDEECQSNQNGFAWGTFEIKIAWKVLTNPDTSFYTMQATLPGGSQPVTLGLVGFHIANWTANHPEMIWATFEHKTNAPLCDGSSAMPASGWSFASNDAAQCLSANQVPGGNPPSTACAQYTFNTPDPFTTPNPPQTNTPNNICRQFAYGNQPGTAINGNDNAANLLAIQQLNDQLVGPSGMLTKLPDTDPMAIWKNYEMIGGIWTKDGASSGNPPVSHTVHANTGDKIVPGDPKSPQRGSLELANMSMETFQQGDTSWAPNCFGCHGFDTATPLNVSHICSSLFTADKDNNCVIPPKTGAVATAPEAVPAEAPKK